LREPKEKEEGESVEAGDVEIEIDKLEKLVELGKRIWELEDEMGKRFHDLWLFGTLSILKRNGIKKDDARKYVEELLAWSREKGLDSESDLRHHSSIVDYIYKPEAKVWGWRKFEGVLDEICKIAKYDDLSCTTFKTEVADALNISIAREVGKPLCVVVKDVEIKRDGRRVAKYPIAWICNTRDGIWYIEKKKRERKDEETGELVEEEEYIRTKLADVYINSMVKYVDALVKSTYISATISTPGKRTQKFEMVKKEKFAKELENFRVKKSWEISPLLERFEANEDVIISGFVCGPEELGIPCGIRDYFKLGYSEANREQAREAFEALWDLVLKYAPNAKWAEDVYTGLSLGTFANFSLTRKLFGVRPMITVFVGEPRTGKTTVLDILGDMFNVPRHAIGGATSRARMGRITDRQMSITALMILDEVKMVSGLLETLKTYVTQFGWTAHGEKWPAYAGIVMAANEFKIDDPALSDKILVVEFTERVDDKKSKEFNAELFKIRKRLRAFGTYYLKFAEENWNSIKDVVLGEPYFEMANEYFKAVLESLGISIKTSKMPASISNSTALTIEQRMLAKFAKIVREYQTMVPKSINSDYTSFKEAVLFLIEKGFIGKYIRLNDNSVDIMYNFAKEIGLTVESICRELDGEVFYTRNHRNHKGCRIPLEKFEEIFESTPQT